jgi:hypothetical protein
LSIACAAHVKVNVTLQRFLNEGAGGKFIDAEDFDGKEHSTRGVGFLFN